MPDLNEGNAAFVRAQTVLMECEMQGMIAENHHRLACGNSIAYGEEAFTALRQGYESVIGYNAIHEMFNAQ